MRNGRRDANHREILEFARSVPGVSAFDTADVGSGFVDIVIGYGGRTYLVEVKDGNKSPSRRKLTAAEEKFHREWTGHVCVVNSQAELLELLQLATIDAMLAVGADNSQGVAK